MDESTAWGELRSFVSTNEHHPYKLEAILRSLGPQRPQGLQYALKLWGLSEDWTLEALRWAHGFELYLGAPLRAFPAGEYGHFNVECYPYMETLLDYELDEDVGAPIINDPDGFIVSEYPTATRQEFVASLGAQGYRTFSVDDCLYMNFGAAAYLAQVHGVEEFDELYHRTPTDGTLYDALMTMFDERYFIEDHPSPPDEAFAQLLEQIEDDEVRQPFHAFSTGDPDFLVCHLQPAALKEVGPGLHPVLEIEDQCQQDYLTMVCYIGPGSL